MIDNGCGLTANLTESGLANLRRRATEAGGGFSIENTGGGTALDCATALIENRSILNFTSALTLWVLPPGPICHQLRRELSHWTALRWFACARTCERR
ncbi:hypothetical protein BH10ACT9_BH10ACT9_59070 [soil metagenome]